MNEVKLLQMIHLYIDSHRSDPLPQPLIGNLKEKSTQTTDHDEVFCLVVAVMLITVMLTMAVTFWKTIKYSICTGEIGRKELEQTKARVKYMVCLTQFNRW